MGSLTKRDVLVGICEQPGWSPPGESSQIERWLSELQNDGLIVTRIDGWEATHIALDAYPRFEKWPEVADLTVAASQPRPRRAEAEGDGRTFRIALSSHQRVEQAVTIDEHLKGSVVFVNSAHRDMEIEVKVAVRGRH